MGLYDIIESTIRCPNCDQPLEWQSKYVTYDGFLLDNVNQTIPLTHHVNGEMHALCDRCRIFYEADIVDGKEGPLKSSRLPDYKST